MFNSTSADVNCHASFFKSLRKNSTAERGTGSCERLKTQRELEKNIKPCSTCTSRSFAHAGLPQSSLSLPLCSLGVQFRSLKSRAFHSLGAETEVGHGPLMIGDCPTANTPPRLHCFYVSDINTFYRLINASVFIIVFLS